MNDTENKKHELSVKELRVQQRITEQCNEAVILEYYERILSKLDWKTTKIIKQKNLAYSFIHQKGLMPAFLEHIDPSEIAHGPTFDL